MFHDGGGEAGRVLSERTTMIVAQCSEEVLDHFMDLLGLLPYFQSGSYIVHYELVLFGLELREMG